MKKESGQSFQEFLRTYEQKPQALVKNPIRDEMIFPLCLERFAPGSISSDYPYCADCSSEGIDLAVRPFAGFMAESTPEEFDSMLERWESVEGLRPEYKALKSQRILALKAI